MATILRILWMLRMVTPPHGEGSKGSRSSKVQKDVSPDEEDDKPPQEEGLKSLKSSKVQEVVSPNKKAPASPSNPLNLSNPLNPLNLSNKTSSQNESGERVAAPAAVTFGSSCSKPQARSQVLSLLRSDCLRSTRRIDLLVLHCTDTRPNQNFTIGKLIASHRARGFGDFPGYHLYVRRDGSLFYCRPVGMVGCHVKGWNRHSIGICYEGGHSCSPEYKYEDNRTAEQMVVLDEIFALLHEVYPEARIVGHCELNPRKACPCLDPPPSVEYSYIFN